jgi:hypothetical protein
MELKEALDIMKQVCREQLLTSEALNTLIDAAVKNTVEVEPKNKESDGNTK